MLLFNLLCYYPRANSPSGCRKHLHTLPDHNTASPAHKNHAFISKDATPNLEDRNRKQSIRTDKLPRPGPSRTPPFCRVESTEASEKKARLTAFCEHTSAVMAQSKKLMKAQNGQ